MRFMTAVLATFAVMAGTADAQWEPYSETDLLTDEVTHFTQASNGGLIVSVFCSTGVVVLRIDGGEDLFAHGRVRVRLGERIEELEMYDADDMLIDHSGRLFGFLEGETGEVRIGAELLDGPVGTARIGDAVPYVEDPIVGRYDMQTFSATMQRADCRN